MLPDEIEDFRGSRWASTGAELRARGGPQEGRKGALAKGSGRPTPSWSGCGPGAVLLEPPPDDGSEEPATGRGPPLGLLVEEGDLSLGQPTAGRLVSGLLARVARGWWLRGFALRGFAHRQYPLATMRTRPPGV